MAYAAMWQDKAVRAEFEVRARTRLAELEPELGELQGILAIEPESGDFFVGATLGQANSAAFERYPDQWLYFVRLDNPEAAISLPTW